MKKAKKSGWGKFSTWDFLKIGALAVAAVFVVRIATALYSDLTGFSKRAWEVAKAESKVIVGLPIAVALIMMIFPDVSVLSMTKDTVGNLLSFAPNPSMFNFQMPPPGLTTLSELRACTNTMTYGSMVEAYPGKRCADQCKERGYTSYGIVGNKGAYDCYCCNGTGKNLE